MDQDKRHQLKEVQHRDEILVISEFDFPFPRFDILLKERTIILRLHGFGVVRIIGLNPNLARVGDVVLFVTHTRMYTRIHIWLKIGDGMGGWTLVAQH
jgi:hypothetical protein